MMRLLFCLSLMGCPFIAYTQNQPVAESLSSMVDPFSGDFNYSVPLLSVPGPNGENIPVVASYHAGIRMDEQASWIGLGWGYSPGEINRDALGSPDDWKNKNMKRGNTAYNSQTGYWEMTYQTNNLYGPLYFKNFDANDANAAMDIYGSSKGIPSVFNFPDYDNFHVSGPGISGNMSPKIFDFSTFDSKEVSQQYQYQVSSAYLGHPFSQLSKTVNFVFDNDVYADIISPHHSYSSTAGFLEPFYGPYNIPNNTYAGAYNSSANRAHSSFYVEYYTNNDINTNYTAIKAAGFLDYRTVSSGDRRPSSEFDLDGVGAFRITTPEGMVYHYSLPVYSLENETAKSFSLDGNWDAVGSNGASGDTLNVTEKTARYVISWKLTAITGPDYVDVNANGIADEGDSGYWVAYQYGKWTDAFNWKTPYFNYKHNAFAKRDASGYKNYAWKGYRFEQEGSVSSGSAQQYYLNTIKTATHTAFFIKEVRLDAHSVKNAGNYATPALKLSKIILLRNEDAALLNNTASIPYDNRFTINDCTPSAVVHIGNYTANELAIKSKCLAAVEFVQDYSLCKKNYNNVNNSFTTSAVNYTYRIGSNEYITELYKKFDHVSGTYSTTDASNSGKLTLLEVRTFTDGYVKDAPSTLFDYEQSNSTKNPDYSTFKCDYWGFYKSDYDYTIRGRHTTEGTGGSYTGVDAWSLRKITTPLGGEIRMEYESDKYDKVDYGAGYTFPRRAFLVKTASVTNTSLSGTNNDNITVDWSLTLSSEINKFYDLTCTSKQVFMPFRVTKNTPCTGTHSTSAYGLNPNTPPGPNVSLSRSSTTSPTQVIGVTNMPSASFPNPGSCTNVTAQHSQPTDGWGYINFQFDHAYGGGVRIKKIYIKDPESNKEYANEYAYADAVATSEPMETAINESSHCIESNWAAYDRHMMSPSVVYGKVTVKSLGLDGGFNGSTVLTFNTNDPISMDYISADPEYVSSAYSRIKEIIRERSYNGYFGRLISRELFDKNSNSVLKEVNEYENEFSAVDESFHQALILFGKGLTVYNPLCTCYVNTTDLQLYNIFTRHEYHSVLKKKSIYKDGICISEEILSRNPLTGIPTKTRTIDPTSGITETETRFAYSDYSAMGARSITSTNKNLLSPVTKTTISKGKITRDVNNQIVPSGVELIGGSKTTWREYNPVRGYNSGTLQYTTTTSSTSLWMPHKTYVFNGDANDANWREEGEVTMLNSRYQTLETKAPLNRYSASKYGYDNRYTLAAAADARQADFTFSSFEDQTTPSSGTTHFGGEVTAGSSRYHSDASVTAHSGDYMSKVAASAYGPGFYSKGFTVGRTYKASVWVHKNSPSNAQMIVHLTGSDNSGVVNSYTSIQKSDASNITIGDWTLMTLTVTISSSYAETGGTFNDLRVYLWNPGGTDAYFDDLRVQPVDADMTGYVYDEKTGRLKATLDNNNFATRNEYDAFGRLKEVWIETEATGWRLAKRYQYNFSRSIN